MMIVILGGLAGVLIGCVLAYFGGLWMGKRMGRQIARDTAHLHRRP